MRTVNPKWKLNLQQTLSTILDIWNVPKYNVGLQEVGNKGRGIRVTVSDLVQANFLNPGQPIFARVQAHFGREAFISEDGGIFVNGAREETPSGAAKKVTKNSAEDGWWFWLVDVSKGISLSDIRKAYVESLQMTEDDDD